MAAEPKCLPCVSSFFGGARKPKHAAKTSRAEDALRAAALGFWSSFWPVSSSKKKWDALEGRVSDLLLQNTGALPEGGHITSLLQLNEITGIMNRELTPLDYELLLSLEEVSVKPEEKRRKATERARQAGVETLPHASSSLACGQGCVICLTDFEAEDDVRKLPCGHLFHRHCIGHWLTHGSLTCPVCSCEALPAAIDDGWEAFDVEDKADESDTTHPSSGEALESLTSSTSGSSVQQDLAPVEEGVEASTA